MKKITPEILRLYLDYCERKHGEKLSVNTQKIKLAAIRWLS